MRRTLQTVAVPVFQFGLFSENDLSFFAGPNFNFGGRVHSNANVYLASGNGTTLTLADRVTAVGEVIRTNLSNGWDTNTNYTGTVQVIQDGAVDVPQPRAQRRQPGHERPGGAERADVDVALGRHVREQHPQRPHRRAAARSAAGVAGSSAEST